MIKASEVAELRTVSEDYPETQRLMSLFARLRQERDPLFLTLSEFDEVLRWKLRGQYGRSHLRRQGNTESVIQTVTGAALSLSHKDPEYELELRVAILCALRGVSVPVASAVLTLVFPQSYGVVDFRVWRQLFGEERRQFGISEYKRYLKKVCALAEELNWTVQEVDLAIWAYDMKHGGGSS